MKRFAIIAIIAAALLSASAGQARPKQLPVEKPNLEMIEDSVLDPAASTSRGCKSASRPTTR